MRPKTALLVGLLLGAFFGLAYLSAPITLFPFAAVWAWLLRRPGRLPAIAGGLIGFGSAWLLFVGRYIWPCAIDPTCVRPVVAVLWVGIGAAFLASGAFLALVARTQLLDG